MESRAFLLGLLSLLVTRCMLVQGNDGFLTTSMYPGNSAEVRPQSAKSGHILVDRKTFSLKEESICGGFGFAWLSHLSCPASRGWQAGDIGFTNAVIGQCFINTVSPATDLDIPTGDPTVFIWGSFTATCHMRGSEECGPDCSFVGTVTGTVYEYHNTYTADGKDPSDAANWPRPHCDVEKRRQSTTRSNTTEQAAPISRRQSIQRGPTAHIASRPAQYEGDAYSGGQSAAALPETVYTGVTLVYSGHMDVATLDGDEVPGVGGWMEYYFPHNAIQWATTWLPIKSADLPSDAKRIDPYSYRFQLWKPVDEHQH